MKKLIGMTDFVLQCDNNDLSEYKIESMFRYANFLKRPLELGFFVPCDLDGNVLSEPKKYLIKVYEEYEYEQAKERVIFEGFKLLKRDGFYILLFPNMYNKDFSNFTDAFNKWTIKDLVKHNLTLTENAIKKLGI